jgi:putative glutamine amidotransferase
VKIADDSWFREVTGDNAGEVNSNHHQSIEQIGNGLVISAYAEDGIAEAADRIESQGKGFLCLVQWHPERMRNQQSPFVVNLREAFVKAAKTLI